MNVLLIKLIFKKDEKQLNKTPDGSSILHNFLFCGRGISRQAQIEKSNIRMLSCVCFNTTIPVDDMSTY
jgi:hypothetical protein